MKKQKPKKNKPKKAVAKSRPVKKVPKSVVTGPEIYLDYASATPVSKAVEAAMAASAGFFANPGGLHAKAVEVKNLISESRKTIARLIDARPEEIVFTANATEANTLALNGAITAWRNVNPNETPHIIISAIEHPSIIEVAKSLEEDGVSVTRIGVDTYGMILLPELKDALQPNTVVVSIMQANNEIGTIEPIDQIVKTVRHYRKENVKKGIENTVKDFSLLEYPLIHVDATQAFQYLPVRIVKPEVELMTLSSGKIYGPRGIALLFVRNNIGFTPTMPGGGQEGGRRGGTEATSLIVGFAKAVEETVAFREKESIRLKKILEAGKQELSKKIPTATLLGHPTNRLPNNLCFSIEDVESEYLVLELSAKKIYASSRSSCKSESTSDSEVDSHVIMAIGGSPTDGTVRLSFGRDTKETDVRRAIAVIAEATEKWKSWSHAHKVNLTCQKPPISKS
jgi:cysteine desulfurase